MRARWTCGVVRVAAAELCLRARAVDDRAVVLRRTGTGTGTGRSAMGWRQSCDTTIASRLIPHCDVVSQSW